MTKVDKQQPEAAPKRKAVEAEDKASKKSKSSNGTSHGKAPKQGKTRDQSDGVWRLLMPCPSARKVTVHEANPCTPDSSKRASFAVHCRDCRGRQDLFLVSPQVHITQKQPG